jgi:2,5-diketo-D-gluconate reductase A
LAQGRALADPAIGEIAARLGRTPAEVVVRWHLQQGIVLCPKTANPHRLAENLTPLTFELDAEVMAAIDALDRPDGRFGPDPLQHVTS